MQWRALMIVVGLAACERADRRPSTKTVRFKAPRVTTTLVDPGREPRAVRRFHLEPSTATVERVADASDHVGTSDMRYPLATMSARVVATAGTEGHAHLRSTLLTAHATLRPGDRPLPAQATEELARMPGATLELDTDPRGAPVGEAVATMDADLRDDALVPFTAEYTMALPDEPIGVGARWTIVITDDKLEATTVAELRAADGDVLDVRVTVHVDRDAPTGRATADGVGDWRVDLTHGSTHELALHYRVAALPDLRHDVVSRTRVVR